MNFNISEANIDLCQWCVPCWMDYDACHKLCFLRLLLVPKPSSTLVNHLEKPQEVKWWSVTINHMTEVYTTLLPMMFTLSSSFSWISKLNWGSFYFAELRWVHGMWCSMARSLVFTLIGLTAMTRWISFVVLRTKSTTPMMMLMLHSAQESTQMNFCVTVMTCLQGKHHLLLHLSLL